jgi:putative transposase
MPQRKATFRLYPNATESSGLEETHALHCRVTNTLIEEHKRKYEEKESSFSFSAMCRAITKWRSHSEALDKLNAQSLQVTAKRCTLAFDGFFRRVANGETPGYPRFKSRNRFSGWGYKAHGDGWKLMAEHSSFKAKKGYCGTQYGAVRLSGIGTVSMRGCARFAGTPKTAEVFRKGNVWFLSVTFNVTDEAIARKSGTQSMSYDWGVNTLLKQIIGDWDAGTTVNVENPRWLRNQVKVIKDLQRGISLLEESSKELSGKKEKFPVSAQLEKLYQRLRKIHSKIARQRNDFYHKLTSAMVSQFGLIVTEKLAVKNMTKKPKPIKNEDGKYAPNGAAAKAGLNRSILETAPAGIAARLRIKAEEAGSKFVEIPTRMVKPSQRCCMCGDTKKHTLNERTYSCACGHTMDRDENAARTMMRYAYVGAWWKTEIPAGTVGAAGSQSLS